MRNTWLAWCGALLMLAGCSPKAALVKKLVSAEKDFDDHIGFYLYDPVTQRPLVDFQGDRYFTPASNTKVFTFYTSLRLLGDSIPVLRFAHRGDTLHVWGTGDPSFLYPAVHTGDDAYRFLQQEPGVVAFSGRNFSTEMFGPGWSWDDYMYDYQVERTSFPLYGNLMSIRRGKNGFAAQPSKALEDVVIKTGGGGETYNTLTRDMASNRLTFVPGKNNSPLRWALPFHVTDKLVASLLSDTLKRTVYVSNALQGQDVKTLKMASADSLYKVMLQASDNFIAEQLLILCSSVLGDTLRTEKTIDYAMKQLLNDLPDKPVWVDGSGLSRYNLCTPRALVRLWEKIGAIVPERRLFELVAVGGKSGTLKRYYKGDDQPYIFGKTGSLSNNYSLSGYLVTRKGTKLIFSWMNSNFITETSQVRARMEQVLKTIYEKY